MSKYLGKLIQRNQGFRCGFINKYVLTGAKDRRVSPNSFGVLSYCSPYLNHRSFSVRKSTLFSDIRQDFHEESENGINKQINLELYASYVYLAMAYHFDRHDAALGKISEYFKKCSLEEREHALKFMKFQNQRGGTIELKDIKAPSKSKWESSIEAMEDALELEKTVNQSLRNLHKIASKHEDSQMEDFIASEYLSGIVKEIKELGEHITNLKRVGSGLGEYIFDKELK